MYIKLRNTAQAQLQLNMLDNLAEESGNPELTEELLYTKTDYFYIFEQKKKETQHSTSSSANTGRKGIRQNRRMLSKSDRNCPQSQ